DVAEGSYSLTAVAIDDAGLTATSAAVVITVNAAPPPPKPNPPPSPETMPLVQEGNLVYEGAFRVPQGNFAGPNLSPFELETPRFEFGGTAIAFNADRNSLFAVGHDFSQTVAEIGIPAIVMGTTVADLQTSSMLQNFNDITDGHFGDVYNAGMDPSDKLKLGGLLTYKGKLYASVYDFYDANMAQITSHFVSGLDLSVNGDVQGPFQVGGALGVKGFAGLI